MSAHANTAASSTPIDAIAVLQERRDWGGGGPVLLRSGVPWKDRGCDGQTLRGAGPAKGWGSTDENGATFTSSILFVHEFIEPCLSILA